VAYPAVIGRAFLPEENRGAIDVRMSDGPLDVMHLDLKPGESMTDEEAILVCEYMREVKKIEDSRKNG
jgi:hypothetical protein